jgi:hypothetical protein
MMSLLRASLLVALSLLTWAATAYAECAWVLWVNEVNLQRETQTWTPMSSYETLDE